MPSSAARFLAFFLPLFAGVVRAVSLADFTPRIDDLTGDCATVYNKQIKDCSASDLQTGDNCSVACISGLLVIAQQVKASCSNADVAETSIIGVFLLGKGPETLCTNIAATTIGSGQSSTTSTTSSITEESSTLELSSVVSTPSSTAVATSTTSTTSTAASTTAATTESSTTAAQTTTSTAAESTPESTAAATTTASSETATAQAASTTSSNPFSFNDGSGGGSPFDFVTNGSAVVESSTWLVGMALGICVFLAQSLLS